MYLDAELETNLKDKLLLCAINEFAEKGFDGARIENIVIAAGCSKQTVYHHYGNKENLFIAVIEYSWEHIRSKELMVDLVKGEPVQNLGRIIDFTWDYYLKYPWYLKIVNSENQSKGVHLKKSKLIGGINSGHISLMERIIKEGQEMNLFRDDIDPVQVNISIAALGFFYLINQHTLSHIYKMQMTTKESLDRRHSIIKDTILRWVCINID